LQGRLWWLPEPKGFRDELELAKNAVDPVSAIRNLANYDLDLSQILAVDRLLRKLLLDTAMPEGRLEPLKVALLGSATLDHLCPALRVAGVRHGYLLDVYVGDYGQYLGEVLDPTSRLHQFRPDIVVLAIDAHHLIGIEPVGDSEATLDAITGRLAGVWEAVQANWGAQVIQQAVLPVLPSYLGGNEHRMESSPSELTVELNARIRAACAEREVEVLAIDRQAVEDGLKAWHDPVLWLRAKQEISPLASHHYADLVLRLISARRGRSGKCLVVDLDNTLWGGVIGDDGLGGIVLGQGSAVGEAYVAFQKYILGLSERGILLAVCSKNDETNALEPFEQHPEMVLRRERIASFVANWQDKATNLRQIAGELNIGLDALVFVDDNPFERNIVRRELPMVRVPELPEDPAFFGQCLVQSGFFEAVAITNEDLARTQLYQARRKTEAARAQATDLDGYLKSLNMVLEWRRFDEIGRQRITQLVNKTNQFNLTTRRYTDAEIGQIIADPTKIALQIRLRDDFADHGIIAILIADLRPDGTAAIDTWLMSCRVLGRGVEKACHQVIAENAIAAGATTLTGRYIPTAKNGMVKGHYHDLGFSLAAEAETNVTDWSYDLAEFSRPSLFIRVLEN
jgi:FkbH-like protein